MSKARVAVFIDGLNLMFRLRELGWEEFFDVCNLAERLTRNRELVSVHYYRPRPSIPPIKTQQQYWDEVAHTTKVEAELQARHGRLVRYGYMAPRGWGWSEKQTDVWIAAEMVSLASRDEYDIAVLVTADSDLVPAVEFVRIHGKGVELVVFPRANPTVTQLIRSVNSTTTARRAFFQPYA